MKITTETLAYLLNNRNHARKHAENIEEYIQNLEVEIQRHKLRLREANRCADLAQSELESAYPDAE